MTLYAVIFKYIITVFKWLQHITLILFYLLVVVSFINGSFTSQKWLVTVNFKDNNVNGHTTSFPDSNEIYSGLFHIDSKFFFLPRL